MGDDAQRLLGDLAVLGDQDAMQARFASAERARESTFRLVQE